MRERVPLALSIAALVVALLGLTPAVDAAEKLAQRVGFAENTLEVNGIRASRTPRPNRLFPLGADKRFPVSVVPERSGLKGPSGPDGDAGRQRLHRGVRALAEAHVRVAELGEDHSSPGRLPGGLRLLVRARRVAGLDGAAREDRAGGAGGIQAARDDLVEQLAHLGVLVQRRLERAP